MSQPKDIRRRVSGPWRILVAALLLQTGTSVVETGVPTLTGFIKRDLGLSAATASLGFSLYLAGKVLGSYVAGLASDHVGEAKILVTGAFLTAGFFLVAMTLPYPALFGLFVVAGLAASSSAPAGGSLIRNTFRPQVRGMALGIRQTGLPLGGLIAAGLLPWIANAYGWRWSLSAAALICATAAVPLLVIGGATVRVATAARARTERKLNRDVRLLTAWGCALVVGQFTLLIYLPLDLHQRKQLSLATAASLIAVAQVAGMVGRVLWGVASDRTLSRGRKPLAIALTGGGALAALSFFVLPPSAPLGLWVAATAIAGLTLVGCQGVWMTMVTEASPANSIGAATGFAVTFTLLAAALIPPLFGLLADSAHTYRVVWPSLVVVLLLSLLPASFVGRPDRPPAHGR